MLDLAHLSAVAARVIAHLALIVSVKLVIEKPRRYRVLASDLELSVVDTVGVLHLNAR